MICICCGHSNRPDNRFCTYCGARLSEQKGTPAKLIVMSSPGAGREYPLPLAAFYIGRSTTNDLVVDDEQVSGQHASLFYREDTFWVEDLKSTNGTYVNGKRIDQSVPLKDEDLIKIGAMILRFGSFETLMDEEQKDRRA